MKSQKNFVRSSSGAMVAIPNGAGARRKAAKPARNKGASKARRQKG